MTLELRDYKGEKDFTELKRWWEFWRWKDRVDPRILSDIGYVVEEKGIPLCVGWLYTSNSLIANLNFITANPFEDKKKVSKSLDFLIECLSQRALKEGARAIMTTVSNKNLAKRIKKLGFIDNGGNLTHFIRLKWD